jgi:hypothetical protein
MSVKGATATYITKKERKLQFCKLWVLAEKLGAEDIREIAQHNCSHCLETQKLGVSPGTVLYVFEMPTKLQFCDHYK